MDAENASELDLFCMPSGSHANTVGSPTAHLNNEKMLPYEDEDNSNEKEIDNLDALVIEKTISLALAATQHLSRRDSVQKDRRIQFYEALVLIKVAQRLYTPTLRRNLYIA